MHAGKNRSIVFGGAVLAVILLAGEIALSAEGKDPAKETVLIGVKEAGGMSIKLEIEPAQAMFMPMHGSWMEMKPEKGEIHHFEVKPEDPGSKTRLSYAAVKFRAVNKSNGKAVEKELHPMWGGSGLHYAANGVLPGDGAYTATVIVAPPTFARGPKHKDSWVKPVQADFEFTLRKGRVTLQSAGK
jgi:uncharacterized protein involved in high-affinity Fe2+ transport